MAVGKTSVGRRLAALRGWEFFDSDRQIEAMTGRTVAEIWRTDGEPTFRRLEADVLADALASTTPRVIAAAGGTVLDENNRRLMAQHHPVVWLRAKPELLVTRVGTATHRPLLDEDPAGVLERLDTLRERHGDYYQALKTAQHTGFSLAAGQRVAGVAGTALVFGCGGYLLARGQITMGLLVAFIAYSARVAGPVHTLMGVLAGWQRLRVSLERLSEVLDAEPVREASARLPLPRSGALELVGVSFAYEVGKPVLSHACLRIPAGSTVLLSGASGAGKSTLTDLLLGHLHPDQGDILLDGVAIGQVAPAELRRRIAVVDQEPAFFAGTVRENLHFVQPLATDTELTALLHSVSLKAPELHLETRLGAVGAALSRGQRLRLALARAILQDPEILVLDETTSAVDAEMESQLLALVRRRFAGRTCLFITHHVRSAQDWSMVCRLRNGGVEVLAEEGVADAG